MLKWLKSINRTYDKIEEPKRFYIAMSFLIPIVILANFWSWVYVIICLLIIMRMWHLSVVKSMFK